MMEHVWLTVLGLSGLLTLAVLVWPLAARLSFPYTVMLAAIGCAIGYLEHSLGQGMNIGIFSDMLDALHALDITSETILFVFLPALVFESALAIDVRRLMEDIAPILMLAVVGLLISTVFVGLVLQAVTGMALLVCLLLGAIVSATDPVAVVAIFKDLGAPKRLAILVEGESLFNDATAIVVFTILSAMVLGESDAGALAGIAAFAKVFFGGIAVGYILARIFTGLMEWLGDAVLPQITLTLTLAYLSFLLAEHYLHVSGVMAVVTASLVLGSRGRSIFSRDGWHEMEGVWEQVGFLANSVIFVLVGIAVPGILAEFTTTHFLWLGVLVLAAFTARFALIFGLVPVLSKLGWAQAVAVGYRAVMFWGGLRGAVSLALALAVMENEGFSPEVRSFVGTLVTGFVLVTLAVNATTVQLVMKAFGLDKLSAVDLAVRDRALSLGLAGVGESLSDVARSSDLPDTLASKVSQPYQKRAKQAAAQSGGEAATISHEAWLQVGLKVMTAREQQVYQEQLDQGLISSETMRRLLRGVNDLQDGIKADGRPGYEAADANTLKLGWQMAAAAQLQRRLGLTGPLTRQLAQRFEYLQATTMGLRKLAQQQMVNELAQPELAVELAAVLQERLSEHSAALQCLRAAYPEYAAGLEEALLEQIAVRLEYAEYKNMRAQSAISKEVYSDLKREVDTHAAKIQRPTLDLGLEAQKLVQNMPFFAGLPEDQQKEVCRMLKPRLVLPGEQVITQGERGDCMYFISSGAARVVLDPADVILGRGDFFGEMALLEDAPRKVSVVSEGFTDLLTLFTKDFRTLLARHPELKSEIEAVARDRA
ncbi:MAG: cation:proton antiporter [Pseudomonadota bacterium]